MLHLEIDNCKFTDIPNELGKKLQLTSRYYMICE